MAHRETKVNYAVVGAFVLVLGAVLIAGVLWLASGGASQKKYAGRRAVCCGRARPSWLPMEERFTLYGGNVSFIEPGAPVGDAVDGAMDPVHGPFSDDFRWVGLQDEHEPIALTQAQAAVFKALWHFGGQPREAHVIMARAGFNSDKPIDVFKVKTQNKGDARYEGAHRAYKALVKTNQRAGTYAMPCAAVMANFAPS